MTDNESLLPISNIINVQIAPLKKGLSHKKTECKVY